MTIEWSDDALADLDRFAAFLHDKFPTLAPLVAATLIEASQFIGENPHIGRPLAGRSDFRQYIAHVLNAAYVLQYRVVGERVVILRAFHGRELRP